MTDRGREAISLFEFATTELIPLDVCGQMARALGRNGIDEANKLHSILNDSASPSGSIAYMAAYLDGPAHGMSPADQYHILKKLAKMGEQFISDLCSTTDWQTYSLLVAAYAKD